MIYRFSCPLCKRVISRREVWPITHEVQLGPSGINERVIVRAVHSTGCVGVGELDIEYLGDAPQTKLTDYQRT